MLYSHYFESDSSKIVSHKPVNLEISTLSHGLKRKFTLAIKTSEDKIKRRLNKTSILNEIYITSENDSIYMERAKIYMKKQALQATATASHDTQPLHTDAAAAASSSHHAIVAQPTSKAQAAHRNEQMNYIGSKEIFTTHPGNGIICIKLKAADDAQPSSNSKKHASAVVDPDSEASNDGFLYSVETKGGKSLGRQKQRYILLKRSCIYALLLPSDILVTKIETKDKHGEVVAMKHWISSTAQLTAASKSPMDGNMNISPMISPNSNGSIAALPTMGMNSPFIQMNGFPAQMGMNGMGMNGMGMGMNNLSPFNVNSSLASGISPARSVNSAFMAQNGNTLSPANNNFNFMLMGHHKPHQLGFSPGLAFPSPTSQLMHNLNLMLPSSNNASPSHHMLMASSMLLSNGSLSNGSRIPSHSNSGQNSVIMSPMLSPASGFPQQHAAATQAGQGSLNTQAIQQQIAHLQSMLNQQKQPKFSSPGLPSTAYNANLQANPNNANSFHPPQHPPTHSNVPSNVPSQPNSGTSNTSGRNKFVFDTPPPSNQPSFQLQQQHPSFIGSFSPSEQQQQSLLQQSSPRSMNGHNLLNGHSHDQQHNGHTVPSAISNLPMPPLSPSFTHASDQSMGQNHANNNLTRFHSDDHHHHQAPQQFPNSPVLPGNTRSHRDHSNNGLYHSFDSNAATVSLHSSTDSTRDNSSADSSAINSLRNSVENLPHGSIGQYGYPRQQLNNHPSNFSHQFIHESKQLPIVKQENHHQRQHVDSMMMIESPKNPMSSAFWNPPNPNPPPPSVAHSHTSLPDVSSPDFLCQDLFVRDGLGVENIALSQVTVPNNFFASPLVASGDTDSSNSGSAGSSPNIPAGQLRSNHVPSTSAAALAHALKAPAQAAGLNGVTIPDQPRSNSASSGSVRRPTNKRKKTTTKKKKLRKNTGSGTSPSMRKLYSLSPRLWNVELKKPPFRSTLTVGKNAEKFKSSDVIQVKFGGVFLEAAQIDQYKKHLLIDIPPPPNPTSLLAPNQLSAVGAGGLDLTHSGMSIDVDLELHMSGNKVFSTTFTYKFGGANTLESTTSSSEDEDDDDDDTSDSNDSEDEDSMDSNGRGPSGGGAGGSSNGSSGSAGSPDRENGSGRRDGPGGGASSSSSKRRKGHEKGGWTGGSQHAVHSAVRLNANFENVPLFSTGVLKAYPLLNAGLQDLLQNYLLHGCITQAVASTVSPMDDSNAAVDRILSEIQLTPAKTRKEKRYSVGAKKSSESSGEEDKSMTQQRSSQTVPSTPSSHAAVRLKGPLDHANAVTARVTARFMFIQALTSANPMVFVHAALAGCIQSAANGGSETMKKSPLAHTSINALDSFGFSLLHYCVSVGDLALSELLLSLGADASLKARNKHSMYAFTPTQLVSLRVAEAEKSLLAKSKQSRSSGPSPSGDAELSKHGSKKRRTDSGNNSGNTSSSEDSIMGDTHSSSPIPIRSFTAGFSSLHSLNPSPTQDSTLDLIPTPGSLTTSPTAAQSRPLFKALSPLKKSFSFSPLKESNGITEPKQMMALNSHIPLHQNISVSHMQQQQLVSPTATTTAPTPSSMMSSPGFCSKHNVLGSPMYGSFPSTPIHQLPSDMSYRVITDPVELNHQFTTLFKSHTTSAAIATTDSASEMSDHAPTQVSFAQPIVNAVAVPSLPTAGLLHISQEMESYLESRWIQVHQKMMLTAHSTHIAATADSTFSCSDAANENQHEVVMLELALLIHHAHKQMQQLDMELPEQQQTVSVDSNQQLSSPVQSLHIHTLRSLLSQFHLLLKYYESYQKHKFEQEQMNSLVNEIDNVGFTAVNASASADHTLIHHALPSPTHASDSSFTKVGLTSQVTMKPHSSTLSDAAIHALFMHVSSIELQLRAHILHMQECLSPFITRALGLKRLERERSKQSKEKTKISKLAASLTDAIHDPSYAVSAPTSSRRSGFGSSGPLPPVLSQGHLSRTHSGQLSLNIVGSLHPDEDDDSNHIEIREIHGVDPMNEQRIDLQLNPGIQAMEIIATAERTKSRQLHASAHTQSMQQQEEKLQIAVNSVSSAHIPVKSNKAKSSHTLAVAPHPTPAATPMARQARSQHAATNADSNMDTPAVLSSTSSPQLVPVHMPGTKFALLIGINHYSPDLHIPSLLGCENDVVKIGNIIHDKYGFDLAVCRTIDDGSDLSFPLGSRTQALLHSGATRLAVRRALISLVNSVTSVTDSVLIYFAGHGFSECIIAFDGMLDYSEITFLLEGLQTRDVAFISDTCSTTSMETNNHECKNTSLTLEEMRALVDARDHQSQQAAAAQILATISPDAPSLHVTSSNSSTTGYEGGDEEQQSIANNSNMDSSDSTGDDEEEEEVDDAVDEAFSDADEAMADETQPTHPVRATHFRGLAFQKIEPAEPNSESTLSDPAVSTTSRTHVIPVIQRLFSNRGYFARGFLSREDPRASEVEVGGKWQGAYTARLCEKLENFHVSKQVMKTAVDDIDDSKFDASAVPRSEPANPTIISLAQILFHDEEGGNLSGRDSISNSRSNSFSAASSPRDAAAAVYALDSPSAFQIASHQTDEIDPELMNCTASMDVVPDATQFAVDECLDLNPADSDSDIEHQSPVSLSHAIQSTTSAASTLMDESEEYCDQIIPDDDSFICADRPPANSSAFFAWMMSMLAMMFAAKSNSAATQPTSTMQITISPHTATQINVDACSSTASSPISLPSASPLPYQPTFDLLTTDGPTGSDTNTDHSTSGGFHSNSESETRSRSHSPADESTLAKRRNARRLSLPLIAATQWKSAITAKPAADSTSSTII